MELMGNGMIGTSKQDNPGLAETQPVARVLSMVQPAIVREKALSIRAFLRLHLMSAVMVIPQSSPGESQAPSKNHLRDLDRLPSDGLEKRQKEGLIKEKVHHFCHFNCM